MNEWLLSGTGEEALNGGLWVIVVTNGCTRGVYQPADGSETLASNPPPDASSRISVLP